MAAGAGADDERIPMMAHLIDLGYDVDATDDVRKHLAIRTPLHYAIRVQSLAKVNFLLQKGADSHKPVGLSVFPFKMAERMGKDRFVSLLKQLPKFGGIRANSATEGWDCLGPHCFWPILDLHKENLMMRFA